MVCSTVPSGGTSMIFVTLFGKFISNTFFMCVWKMLRCYGGEGGRGGRGKVKEEEGWERRKSTHELSIDM